MKRVIGFWLAIVIILSSMLFALWHIYTSTGRDTHREAQKQEEAGR